MIITAATNNDAIMFSF